MPSVQWTVLLWSHSHRGLDYQVKRMLKPMLVTQDFLIWLLIGWLPANQMPDSKILGN